MKVRELLTDASKWTQRAYSRNAGGQDLFGWDEDESVCWCLSGAIYLCYGNGVDADAVFGRVEAALQDPTAVYPGDTPPIPYWNDHSTFADVKALVEQLDI